MNIDSFGKFLLVTYGVVIIILTVFVVPVTLRINVITQPKIVSDIKSEYRPIYDLNKNKNIDRYKDYKGDIRKYIEIYYIDYKKIILNIFTATILFFILFIVSHQKNKAGN